ncbi:related to C.carbonum toxD gene [Cephalotrichum gorgonifer]|uniref:Related to C.carbonum toxD protein n=1 Tax=Cephalotrichum gorgonifer TaxID=2041049 RepID=A0AAE8N5V5_9PEZI|nr:related to C.carbonum toxD gene [Cephalotrichum gorgonifer]
MDTMNALITDGSGSASVQRVPRPKPGPGELLIKIHYAAQNPTDWKAIRGATAAMPPAGRIVGCDFAGTVEDTGTSALGFRPGQRVAGFVQGSSVNGTEANPIRGAFADYIPVEETLVYTVPGNISLEDAAAIPLVFATAVQALYQRLTLPEPENASVDPLPFLVYGGATGVGKQAIQLAKLSGCYVIATASVKNHDHLKELGADEVVDYHDHDWPQKVYQMTNGQLRHALDCVGGKGTAAGVAEALSRDGGDICSIIPLSEAVKGEIAAANHKARAQSTIAYTVFGRPLKYGAFDNCGGETPLDKAMWEKYLRLLPGLLSQGRVKPGRVKNMGTLHDILDGLRLSQQGSVAAEKLVYKVVE